MKDPLTACSKEFEGADVMLSFAGSDELAAQIRQGVKPDVFASANTKLPDQLADLGLVEVPVPFATNTLVLAVPKGESKVGSLTDLGDPGVRIAIGSESVPIGAYTRKVLAKLDPAERKAILTNVRSNEPDVKGIVGKLTQRAVDAGFVYRTDVAAAPDRLRAIELPDQLQPEVAYAAAVVRGADHPDAGGRYLEGLRSGACAEALQRAGFGSVAP
jgi:molybdate transport system substrate-binding protein